MRLRSLSAEDNSFFGSTGSSGHMASRNSRSGIIGWWIMNERLGLYNLPQTKEGSQIEKEDGMTQQKGRRTVSYWSRPLTMFSFLPGIRTNKRIAFGPLHGRGCFDITSLVFFSSSNLKPGNIGKAVFKPLNADTKERTDMI